jgi:hypothetical protein
MNRRFTDKVVLVTGASSGIGRASCLLFAAEGARVVAVARREEQGQRTVAAIRQAGGEAVCSFGPMYPVPLTVPRWLRIPSRPMVAWTWPSTSEAAFVVGHSLLADGGFVIQ